MIDVIHDFWPRALPALVTPFDDRGEIDLDAHHHNLSLLHERGSRGVLIGGSTGEGPLLEPGDRRRLVAEARKVQPGGTILCGINAESVRQATAQIDEAVMGGADLALVVTPTTLSRGRLPFVERFYGQVAEESSIPILLYVVPGVTGWVMPTDSVGRVSEHPNIVGMKDSTGAPERLEVLAGPIESGFVAYAGTSRALLESGRHGALGAITASGNYALSDASLAVTGDALAQDRLTALTSVVETFGVPGTKFAASLVGLRPGHARSPLSDVGPDAQAAIINALADAGIG